MCGPSYKFSVYTSKGYQFFDRRKDAMERFNKLKERGIYVKFIDLINKKIITSNLKNNQ